MKKHVLLSLGLLLPALLALPACQNRRRPPDRDPRGLNVTVNVNVR